MWFIDKRIQVICEELKRLAVVKKAAGRKPAVQKKGSIFIPGKQNRPRLPGRILSQGIRNGTGRISITGFGQRTLCRKNWTERPCVFM